MATSLLRIQAPAGMWCRRLRTALATDDLRVGLLVPLSGERFVERMQVPPGMGAQAEAELRRLENVDNVEREDAAPDQLRVRYHGCPIAEVVRESGLVPRFPFQATATDDVWLIDGQDPELRVALEALQERGIRASVEPLQGPLPDQLTRHQDDVLEEAIRLGYYGFPRRISLTEFAEARGVAKSTLSQTLMLIEKKMALHYRDGQGD